MNTSVPALVMLGNDNQPVREIALAGGDLVVGRSETCDIRLPGRYVSRTHARVMWDGTTVTLEDLGSASGTYVNRERVGPARPLRDGDLIEFADVRLRFRDIPATPGAGWYPVSPGPAQNVRYDIGHQQAEGIHNVGRDQYHVYVQQQLEQRENFLREIAATKTKARWLVWLGLLLFLAGFGLFAAGVLRFLAQGADAFESESFTAPTATPFGVDIFGIPSGLIGWAIAAIGTIMLGIGLVLHILATARRKRVDRDLPVPAPWPPGQPTQWRRTG